MRTAVVKVKLACPWGKPRQKMCSCCFAWQAWHFVTFDVCEKECVRTAVVKVKLACPRGGHKNVSFSTCQKMCSCRFAWQARHFVTFDVCEEECVRTAVVKVKLACPWGKPPQRVFLNVSEDVLMPFCVAGKALCDLRRV